MKKLLLVVSLMMFGLGCEYDPENYGSDKMVHELTINDDRNFFLVEFYYEVKYGLYDTEHIEYVNGHYIKVAVSRDYTGRGRLDIYINREWRGYITFTDYGELESAYDDLTVTLTIN